MDDYRSFYKDNKEKLFGYLIRMTGDYDLVCCGHDHRVIIEQMDNMKQSQTTLINPGTVGGIGKKPTYVLGDLAEMRFTVYDVPTDKTVISNTDPVTPHR